MSTYFDEWLTILFEFGCAMNATHPEIMAIG
jgi:hypothetical protein